MTAFFQIKFSVEGEEVIIPLGDAEIVDDEAAASSSDEITQRVLVAKDFGLVSDEAYHELRMALPEDERNALPPISILKQERNRQNKIITLHPIPEVCIR